VLVLNVGLDIVNSIEGFDFKGDSLAGQRLDESRCREGGECTTILKLFAGFDFEIDNLAGLDESQFGEG